ncbi:MAG: tail fiber protein [Candidatus Bathyarchaeota archaeon]|nr:tail fiber protein [Candidatus Bathyarchaeota archaeon]
MVADGFGRWTPVLSGRKIVRALSIDDALIPHVSDAIAQLTIYSNWVEVGDPLEDVVAECFTALDSWYLGNMLIGQVSSFLGSLPDAWLPLAGDTFDRDDYPELWDALDAQYKDSTTFTLPDLSDLFLAIAGSGSYSLGDTGGEDDHTLTTAEMPAHTHTYLPPVVDLDLEALGVPDILAARLGVPTPTSSSGGDSAHENRPPFHAVVMGIFAGRD